MNYFRFGLSICTALVVTSLLAKPSPAQAEITVREVVDTAATAGCMYDTREKITLFNVRNAIVCPEKDGGFKPGPNPYLVPIGKDEAIQVIRKVPPKYLAPALETIRENYPKKFKAAPDFVEPDTSLEPALGPSNR